jgi:two-component system sensor histidine kinase UhpB
MYHRRMRSKSLLLPNSGPILGAGYLVLWLLLQTTAQPF